MKKDIGKKIINSNLRVTIKYLQNHSKNINKLIKQLSNSCLGNRLTKINKKLEFINNIINYIKSTKLFKLFKLYNKTVKLIAFLILLLVWSFTKFHIEIEFDYIALLTFISSIFTGIFTWFNNKFSIFKLSNLKDWISISQLKNLINISNPDTPSPDQKQGDCKLPKELPT